MEFDVGISSRVLLYSVRPQWEQLLFLAAVLRTVDRSSEAVRCFSNAILIESDAFSRIPRGKLKILIYLLLSVTILVSSIPVLVLYRGLPGAIRLLGTSIFLFLLDEEAFINRLKVI